MDEPALLSLALSPKADADRIHSREHRGGTQMIRARVPLSELFGYSSNLRERTCGRGTFIMQFDRYQPVRRG